MFETMAVLTTVSLVVVFVILVRIDRAGRREEESTADDITSPPAQ